MDFYETSACTNLNIKEVRAPEGPLCVGGGSFLPDDSKKRASVTSEQHSPLSKAGTGLFPHFCCDPAYRGAATQASQVKGAGQLRVKVKGKVAEGPLGAHGWT